MFKHPMRALFALLVPVVVVFGSNVAEAAPAQAVSASFAAAPVFAASAAPISAPDPSFPGTQILAPTSSTRTSPNNREIPQNSPQRRAGTAKAGAVTAASTFNAGKICVDANLKGTCQQINFTNVGKCDHAGYVVNLQGFSGWDSKVSSVYSARANGCNAVAIFSKILVTDRYIGGAGPFWFNLPSWSNDSVYDITFYCSTCA